MRQKNCSLFCLLMSTMLLFSFSSIFAAVTVTYMPAPTGFPYNTTGNVIMAQVVTTENIAAFDLMSKVRSTVTNAFGSITAVNVSSVAGAVVNLTKVNANSEDTTRIYGFGCATPIIMPTGTYNFTFTFTTSCDTGKFVMEDGGTWVVNDVNATTMFVNTSAVAAALTVVPGEYRVFNTAPTITNCPPQALVFNACAIVTYDFNVTDPDIACLPAADLAWSIVDGPGMIDASTGLYVWDPPAVAGICGLHEVNVKVTDEYGAYATCHLEISLQTDAPTFTECPAPGSELFIYWGWTADGKVTAVDADACPLALAYSVASFSGPGVFTVNPTTGVWNWPTVYGDDAYLGDFNVVINVTDGCITVPCAFVIHVAPTYQVVIEKTHNTLSGHYETVDITLKHWTEGFGGYDFLVAYDNSAISAVEALPGSILTTCGFEYFTYRFGANGNCDGPCPSGFLRIVALADMNNGANHPSCFGENITNGTLAVIKFLVTNDRTLACQFVPVSFYWFDCGDNTISSITGDTLYIDRAVYGYDVPPYPITGDHGTGGWQGTDLNCMQILGQKIHADTVIDFWDGGIDIVCSDSIDARGDLNLNGIANEIADAVLYTNYFLYGISAFDPVYYEASLAASDVNADGKTLTVGDLVYLLRVIVGDALPYPKLAPFSSTADVNVISGKLSTTSSEAVGALYMTFDVTGSYSVVNHSNMEVLSAERDGKLHVLVFAGMNNMRNSIPAGTNELLTVTGAELSSVEISDYYGNLMNTRVEKTALPTQFSLLQNIPNPFNPSTKIGLDLPVVADWKIDIYNVNGQLVQSYNGTNIGHVEVTWDASNVASGVYFYKVSAGSFTDTKKMVLMK